MPTGRSSRTTAASAGVGPWLATVRTQVALPPAVAAPAILVIARSATSPTTVSTWELSLSGFRSTWSTVTDAMLVSVWPPSALGTKTVIRCSTASPTARAPTAHVTVRPATAQPVPTERSSTPAGSGSLTVTPVASDGPWLVVVSV